MLTPSSRSSVALLAVPLLGFATGCSHAIFSPPARAVPLESAATLPKGDTGVQLEGAASGALFGPDVASGAARLRHGLTDDLDIDVDANVMRVTGQSAAVDVNRNIYAVRAGVKGSLAPALGGNAQNGAGFSIAAGLGGGYSAAGSFVSPDVGPILAWENRYFVPFVSGRVGVSQPIGARSVDVSSTDDGPGKFVDTPRTTWIVGVTAGFRVPLGWADEPAGKTRGSLLAGLGMTHLADSRDKETYSHLAVGGELVF